MGMSMQDLADRVGVSYGYMSQVARGHRQHGREGPGAGRVGVAGPGEGSRPRSTPTARDAW